MNVFDNLFGLFCCCSHVHSNQRTGFQYPELKQYFLTLGIATSRSNQFHPQGNGQAERFNGIVWKAVKCALMQTL